MNADLDQVRHHFDRTAENFDAIYSGRKSALARLLDRLLRWDMQERMKLSLQACQPLDGKSILDVGCGTGRYCFALARMGATKILGIDFAPTMIQTAREMAAAEGFADRCTFTCVEIESWETPETFDYVLAVGLFDYIKEDRKLLTRLRHLTRGKLIATFPRANTWRAPLRKLRLVLAGCPVYFYTEKRIRDHLMIAGFMLESIRKVGKLYFIEAR